MQHWVKKRPWKLNFACTRWESLHPATILRMPECSSQKAPTKEIYTHLKNKIFQISAHLKNNIFEYFFVGVFWRCTETYKRDLKIWILPVPGGRVYTGRLFYECLSTRFKRDPQKRSIHIWKILKRDLQQSPIKETLKIESCLYQVGEFTPGDYFTNAKTAKSQDRFTHLAVAAARMAVDDAGTLHMKMYIYI